MTDQSLPEGFEDLQPFISWSIGTESGRVAKRMASEYSDLVALYEAMMPNRILEVLQYLDQFPLDNLDVPQRNLLWLALSLAEVNMAVEVYQCVWQDDVVLPTRMPPAAFSDAQ